MILEPDQIALAACIALLWLLRADRYAMTCLTVNFAVTLAICGAMDIGALDRAGSTSWQMVVDLGTASVMVLRPKMTRVLAMGYAVSIPVYAANLLSILTLDTTFAIVMLVAFSQLGVVTIDTFTGGGIGGGKRGRKRVLANSLAKSPGGVSMAQRAMAGDTEALRGGLNGR